MGNLLLNLRYMLPPILIVVALAAGVLVGGIMAWLGVALLFVGLLIDIATKFETTGVGVDENGDTRGWSTFQNLTMYFMLPVFVLFQLVMAWRIYSYMSLGGAEGVIMELIPGVITMYEGITGLNLIGATLSSGIFIGIGIIYGHELSHTKGFGFVISRLMMGLSGSAHFCCAHVYNHHLELASEDDPYLVVEQSMVIIHFHI